MATHRFIPQSQKWKDARLNCVTATEIASLFGLNPNKSANMVSKDKKEPPVHRDNIYMKIGRYLEPSVFIAMAEHGMPAEPADPKHVVFITHDEYPIGASMDGKMSVEEGFYIVEAKTTINPNKFNEWKNLPPIGYWLQLQTQLLVAKQTKGLLACLFHGLPMPLVVYEIQANKELHQLIEFTVNIFWDCHKSGNKYTVNKDVKARILQIFEESLANGTLNQIFVDNSEL